ncbi:SCP2 sterol-binding domain-containing protein, partial [Candidatus Bathyarchaeota archaeon]|nr:SCP2 sterol-binding domain-containing protein [Candidatus Bathyarchaeota archaeon]
PSQLKMNIASMLCQPLNKFTGQGLSPKLADQTFIVHFASYFPRSNNHFILVFVRQALPPSIYDSSITILEKHIKPCANNNLEHPTRFEGRIVPLEYESQEFSDELKKRINTDKDYREKAHGMNWATLSIIDDVPFATYSNYVNGELTDRKHILPSEADEYKKKVDFFVEIPTYDLSVEMATGKKSLESMFLGGNLKVEGSIFKALQYRDAIERATKITAELANESVIPSSEDFAKMLKKLGLL